MQHLLLLHGAIGAKDQLENIDAALSSRFTVHRVNFNGHGGAAFRNFSIEAFADDVLEYLAANRITQIHIFGYSMGGYVGMYLAKHHPGKIVSVITLATKFHWDPAIALKEAGMLDAGKIEAKVPAFAEALKKRHAPGDWKIVLQNTAAMLKGLGNGNALLPGDIATITCPVLLLLGDRDKMVSLEETATVYRQLPNGQLGVLSNTGHLIEQVDVDRLVFAVNKFMSNIS